MKSLLSVLVICVIAAVAQLPDATIVQPGVPFTATWTLPLDSYSVLDVDGTTAGYFFDTQLFAVWINASTPGLSVNLVGIAGVPAVTSSDYDYLYFYGRPHTPPCGRAESSVEQYSYYPCDYTNWDSDYYYIDTSFTGELFDFNNYNDNNEWSVGTWYFIRVDGVKYDTEDYSYTGVVTVTLQVDLSTESCTSPEVPYGYDDSSSYIECGAAPMTLDPTSATYWQWNLTNAGDLLWQINTTNRMIGQISFEVNITNPSSNVDSNWVLRGRDIAIPTYYSYCDYDYLSVESNNLWAYAMITCVNVAPGTFYLELTSYYSDTISYKEAWNGTLNLWASWMECPVGWAGYGCAEPVMELGLDTVVGVNRTIVWETNSMYNTHYYWVNVTEMMESNFEINPLVFFVTEYTGNLEVYYRLRAPPCDVNSATCRYSDSFGLSYSSASSNYVYYLPLYETDFYAGEMMFIGVSCYSSSANCTYAITRDVPAPAPATSTTTSGTSATSAQTSDTTTTTAATTAATSATMTTTTAATSATMTTTTAATSATMTTTTAQTSAVGTTTAAGTTTSRATTTAAGTTTSSGTTSGQAVSTTSGASSIAVSALLAIVAVALML